MNINVNINMHYSYYFTFWMYIFFVLYLFNIISINPILLFLVCFIRDIYIIIFILNKKINITSISLFRLFLLISLHYIPLYFMLRTYKSSDFNNIIKSIPYFIILSIIYIIYIKYSKLNINYIYNYVVTKKYYNFSVYVKDRFNTIFEFIIFIFLFLYVDYIIITKKY